MIELLIVVLVISVLAGIALLRFIDLRNTARAAEVAGDFRVILVAAYNYQADNNAWPPDAGPGVIPPALGGLLPGGFRFTKPEYTLDYDNLGVGGAYVVGVTVTSANAKLMAKLIQKLGAIHPYFVAGGALTYIISGPGGA
jgi:type II secretory pathway pseudopilin PulG